MCNYIRSTPFDAILFACIQYLFPAHGVFYISYDHWAPQWLIVTLMCDTAVLYDPWDLFIL